MKFANKKASETQDYEDYWKLTVEYTNINGHQFINSLKIIVRFIDENPVLMEKYDSKLYKKLQENLNTVYPKADLGSSRKTVNQFVKLGFIYPKLKGYPKETVQFIKAKNDEERKLLFSEIYYRYASLSSSVTRDYTNIKHINFFLKTLMFHPEQKLSKDEMIGLMTVDITLHSKGYLTVEELNSVKHLSQVINFQDRKYNQISYFMNFLTYVPGIHVTKDKNEIWYVEDDFAKIKEEVNLSRDPILFRIMKEKVKKESVDIYGEIVCYLTKKPQKGLVVSHILPSQVALDKGDIYSAYNPNNALLLEPNIDAYFDTFDLTFDKNNGVPMFGSAVYDHFKNKHKDMFIEQIILNEERTDYLDTHNQRFKDKFNI